MGKDNNPGQDENPAALTQIQQILHEFQIEDVSLFDHEPVSTDTGLGCPIRACPPGAGNLS